MYSSLQYTTLGLVLFCSLVSALTSRTVHRSTENGAVHLIEFNGKGMKFGRCTFKHNGETVAIDFRQTEYETRSRANNPTVIDSDEKLALCRELAAKKTSAPKSQSRSDFGEPTEESELDLYNRMQEFQAMLAQNQDYVKDLDPKFISFLLSAFLSATNLGGYGLSFGSGSAPLFPGINYGLSTAGSGNSIFKWFGKRRR